MHFWSNFHSHSYYCDGKDSPETHVQAALAQGVTHFGFSSHCPVPFQNTWSMARHRLADYLADCAALRHRYAGQITLYTGLEIDFIPGLCGPSDFQASLDYCVGSVHYVDQDERGAPWEIDGSTPPFLHTLAEVYDNDIRYVLGRYYALIRQMVVEDCPTIVGHLDKIKIHNPDDHSLFDPTADWYRKEVLDTLDCIAEKGCMVELNTRGMYKKDIESYPSAELLHQMARRAIPLVINSDSHVPREITGRYTEAAKLAYEAGYRSLRLLHQGEWVEVAFDENGLYWK